MLIKKITSEKIKKDELRIVPCRKCDGKTNHKVHSIIRYSWEYDEYQVYGTDDFETISCLGCDEISFRLSQDGSEFYFEGENGEYEPYTDEYIYPNRLAGRLPLRGEGQFSFKIQNIYKETHTALVSKLNILAGVGIRALVEAVCQEEGAIGSNLESKINNLVEKDILTENNSLILHKTRLLGNKTVHEIEAPKDYELEVAFDIIENLMSNLYIIPSKVKILDNKNSKI